MSKWAEKLRSMADVASSSELHDLKCGLEPAQAREIADELEDLRIALEAQECPVHQRHHPQCCIARKAKETSK